jgi:peptidoglycan L-alanyl-D-glutamate endopeptidase CwlK
MPALSDFSLVNLATCDIPIQRVVKVVALEYDVRVLEGRRSWDRQDQLFLEGRSKKKGGGSKHNPPKLPDGTEDMRWLSLAVDIAPYPIDWEDTNRFVYLAGLMIGVGRQMGFNLRWGGNFNENYVILEKGSFLDLNHFEYLGMFE